MCFTKIVPSSNLYFNLFLPLCLSLHLCATSFLSQSKCPFYSSPSRHFALSEPIYRQSLMHYRHSHQSRFCFTAERSRLSFWLHINCSVGTQNRIVKYFSSLVLFSRHPLFRSHPVAFHHMVPPLPECLIYPANLYSFFPQPPFFLDILFLFSFLSLVLSYILILF